MENSQTRNVNTEYVRLSPWAILHFAARTIGQLVSNAYALVPVVYGLYQTDSAAITLGAFAGILALVVLSATLRYFYFTYLIQNASVQVREGVFQKKQLNLPFHRIQNVNFEHPFYFRPLGLVTVKIDGAGSASEEVLLAALNLEQGQQIREQIHSHNRLTNVTGNADDLLAQSGTAGEVVSTHAWKLMLTRSLPDLVLHGLTNNRAWIILGALGAVYGQAADDINLYIASLGLDLGGFMADRTMIAIVVLGFGALMMAIMIVAGLSVLGSIFSYYKFELHTSNDAFMVRRGLLTHHEINMKKSRIQAVRVKRDWLDMILGRMNVVFEQISYGAGQPAGMGTDKQILVPSVEPPHTDLLTNEALSAQRLSQLEFTPISHRYFNKLATITTVCYCVIALGFSAAMSLSFFWVFGLLLPVLAVHVFLVYMSCKRWGLAIDNGLVVVRKGIFGVDHILIPAFKVQEIGRIQTPLMKRKDLSSIGIAVASSKVSVPFLPDEVVRRVINYCLFEAESTDRSWM
ncbi:MAG: PH domain-containing protein [Gammaproteobacteria bacterium]|nr:PH domain-containing protein [Gammaproteobacteria bacterium]